MTPTDSKDQPTSNTPQGDSKPDLRKEVTERSGKKMGKTGDFNVPIANPYTAEAKIPKLEDDLMYKIQDTITNHIEMSGDPLFDLAKDIEALFQQQLKGLLVDAQKEGYDPNRLGSWIFIGDKARLDNLDDLYWSYVLEYMKQQNLHDKYTLQYIKNNMRAALNPSSFFYDVGLHAHLFKADQRAKERLQQLNGKDKS